MKVPIQFSPEDAKSIPMNQPLRERACLGQSQRDCITQPKVDAIAATLGLPNQIPNNPNGVASFWHCRDTTPSGLIMFRDVTQGSSQARNPGLNDGIPSGFKSNCYDTLLRATHERRAPALACAWLMIAAVAALLVSGCKPSGANPARYETVRAARGDIVQRVTASGTLSAVVSVDVGSQVSGKISALDVDFNSPVKKGQLVAEIDPTVYAASLRQAEGELASAQATVTLKRQNLERKKTLVPLKAASQREELAVLEQAEQKARLA